MTNYFENGIFIQYNKNLSYHLKKNHRNIDTTDDE